MLARFFVLNEVKPFPDRKMIKPLTVDELLPPLPQSAKARSRMTMAITISGQNDAVSCVRTTNYLTNLFLVVIRI